MKLYLKHSVASISMCFAARYLHAGPYYKRIKLAEYWHQLRQEGQFFHSTKTKYQSMLARYEKHCAERLIGLLFIP